MWELQFYDNLARNLCCIYRLFNLKCYINLHLNIAADKNFE